MLVIDQVEYKTLIFIILTTITNRFCTQTNVDLYIFMQGHQGPRPSSLVPSAAQGQARPTPLVPAVTVFQGPQRPLGTQVPHGSQVPHGTQLPHGTQVLHGTQGPQRSLVPRPPPPPPGPRPYIPPPTRMPTPLPNPVVRLPQPPRRDIQVCRFYISTTTDFQIFALIYSHINVPNYSVK